MKLATVDNRKAVSLVVRLDANVYDLAASYKDYAATKGQLFKTDSQLVAAIVEAFVERGDKDFRTWLRLQKMQPLTEKVNGTKEKYDDYK